MIHNQKQIISSLKNDDIGIFEEVYHFYVNKLERFVTEYVNSKEEASDIVQNVFIVLWEKRETLTNDTNLNNYLITLAKNQSLNYIKHQKVCANYQGYKEKIWNEWMLSGYALEQFNSDHLVFEELYQTIQKSIDSLPGQCRDIFIMSRFEDKKYQEIADILSISIKTVEKKMSISLQIFRSALKDYLPFLVF